MNQSSCCSTSSPAFSGVSMLDIGHPIRHVVVSHCYFSLHFPDGIWCKISFHVFFFFVFAVCLVSVVKCLLRSLAHFSVVMLNSLWLNFKSSWSALGNTPLLFVPFTKILSVYGLSSYSLNIFFCKEVLILMKLFLLWVLLLVLSKMSYSYPRSSWYSVLLLPQSFVSLNFIFRSLFHLGLISMKGVSSVCTLMFFACGCLVALA